MRVKEWFEKKMAQELACGGSTPYIISIDETGRETEKALEVIVEYGFHSTLERTRKMWVPKSCVITEEEYRKQLEEESDRIQSGLEYNSTLVAFGKENGLKFRVGMRTATMLEKIANAGLVAPKRA